jgi:integron integrase
MTKIDAKIEALQKFYEGMRLEGKSPDTIKNYRGWAARYIDFISGSDYATREDRISAYLTYLVIKCNEASSTQKQALNAIICFYRLRGDPVGKLNFKLSSKEQHLPVILSREECWKTIDQLTGQGYLWAGLMWGCGLRLNEVCSLRVMDVDLDRMQIHVHEGKGSKDRKVPLPNLLKEPLEKHFRVLHPIQEQYAAVKIPVALPGALDKKYPNAPYSWPWFWMFPASGVPKDEKKWGKRLWHIHKNAVQKRIGRAYRAAKINKDVGCHSLRHAFATHWLENAEGSHEVAIIQLQKLLGHSKPETTMIYLHCVKQKTDVLSPLDVPLKRAA